MSLPIADTSTQDSIDSTQPPSTVMDATTGPAVQRSTFDLADDKQPQGNHNLAMNECTLQVSMNLSNDSHTTSPTSHSRVSKGKDTPASDDDSTTTDHMGSTSKLSSASSSRTLTMSSAGTTDFTVANSAPTTMVAMEQHQGLQETVMTTKGPAATLPQPVRLIPARPYTTRFSVWILIPRVQATNAHLVDAVRKLLQQLKLADPTVVIYPWSDRNSNLAPITNPTSIPATIQ